MIVIGQIFPRQIQDGLLLQSLDERAAQVEKQVPLLIGILGHGDLSLFLRALSPQFPLAPALMQVVDGAGRERVGERRVLLGASVGRSLRRKRIDLVYGAGQIWM